MKRSGSRPPSRVTIFTSKSSSVRRAMDFSVAAIPAGSGSKLTMKRLAKRLRRRICISVKAVAEVSLTVLIPAVGAEDWVGAMFGELLVDVVEVIGGVADAELCDGFGGDAAASEVFAGAGSLGGFESGFEVLGGGFVDVDELAADTGFAGLLGGA